MKEVKKIKRKRIKHKVIYYSHLKIEIMTHDDRLKRLQEIKNGSTSKPASRKTLSPEDQVYIELGITNEAEILEADKEAKRRKVLSPDELAVELALDELLTPETE